jgi:hypothetical protein
VKSGHFLQWNIFGIAETPGNGRFGPKHVVKGRSVKNSCVVDGIILCIINYIRVMNATRCLNTILYSWTVQFTRGLDTGPSWLSCFVIFLSCSRDTGMLPRRRPRPLRTIFLSIHHLFVNFPFDVTWYCYWERHKISHKNKPNICLWCYNYTLVSCILL